MPSAALETAQTPRNAQKYHCAAVSHDPVLANAQPPAGADRARRTYFVARAGATSTVTVSTSQSRRLMTLVTPEGHVCRLDEAQGRRGADFGPAARAVPGAVAVVHDLVRLRLDVLPELGAVLADGDPQALVR